MRERFHLTVKVIAEYGEQVVEAELTDGQVTIQDFFHGDTYPEVLQQVLQKYYRISNSGNTLTIEFH